MGKRSLTADQVAVRAEQRRREDVRAVATKAGVPDAQNDADRLVVVPAAPDTGVRGLRLGRTVRTRTGVETLVARRTLTQAQGDACQAFLDARELGYATLGVTARYGEGGGGVPGSADHFARDKAQAGARADYARMEAALPGRPMSVAVLVELLETGEMHKAAMATFPALADHKRSFAAVAGVLAVYAELLGAAR